MSNFWLLFITWALTLSRLIWTNESIYICSLALSFSVTNHKPVIMGNAIKIPLGHHQISKMTCDWSTQKCSASEQEKYFDLIGPYDSTGNIWMTWRLLCAIWFNLIAFPLYLVKLIVFNLVSSLKPISHGPWVGLWVERIVDQNLVQNAPFRKKSDSI